MSFSLKQDFTRESDYSVNCIQDTVYCIQKTHWKICESFDNGYNKLYAYTIILPIRLYLGPTLKKISYPTKESYESES